MNDVPSQPEPRTVRVDRMVSFAQIHAACAAIPGFVRLGVIVPHLDETVIAPGIVSRVTPAGIVARCDIVVRPEPAPITTALTVQLVLSALLAQGGEAVASVDVHVSALDTAVSHRRGGGRG